MARCLRCKAGNEWIEGEVKPEVRSNVLLSRRFPMRKETLEDVIVLEALLIKVEDAVAQVRKQILLIDQKQHPLAEGK